MKQKVWLIRPSDEYRGVDYFAQNGQIRMGWPQLGDLSETTRREQIRELYRKTFSESTVKTAHVNASQIFAFVHEMQIGDHVFMFDALEEKFYSGAIKSPYMFKIADSDDHPHVRDVQWLGSVKDSSVKPLVKIAHTTEFNILLLDSIHELDMNAVANETIKNRKETLTEPEIQIQVKHWATVIGLVGGIIGIIVAIATLIPTMNNAVKEIAQILRSPADFLIIQDVMLHANQVYDFRVLYEDPTKVSDLDISFSSLPNPCTILSSETCEAILYLGEDVYAGPNELKLTVTSNADSPLAIRGIMLTLIDFRELQPDPLNIRYELAGRGGGGYYNPFDLQEFPIPDNDLSLNYSTPNPNLSIGRSELVTIDCGKDVPNCPEILFLEDRKAVEGLNLKLSFLRKLPPGHYAFSASINYAFEGDRYNSTDKIEFEVIKPAVVRLWTGSLISSELNPSLVDIDLMTNELIVQYSPEPLPNPEGHLIFKSYFGVDGTYFVWDLQSGKISTFSHAGYFKDVFTSVKPSPNGWQQVSQLDTFDIGLVDFKLFQKHYLSQTPFIREIDPVWSPSGNQIAYTAFATNDIGTLNRGQADVFVYDLIHNIHTQVTFTPSIIETHLTWIDDNRIGFVAPVMVPLYGGNEELELQENTKLGLGIVDIASNEFYLINDYPINYVPHLSLEYFSASELLALRESAINDTTLLFNLKGELENIVVDMPSYDCELLNTYPLKQMCIDGSSG